MQATETTALPINVLAAAYQPRRSFAAGFSIAWNLLLAFFFIAGGAVWRLYIALDTFAHSHHLPAHALAFPAYLCICFLCYAVMNYPVELYFGYLEERQFGLAKDGVRAWTRDWLFANLHHALCFCLGGSVLIVFQIASPAAWVAWASLALLALFVTTTYFAPSMIPGGLFDFEPVDEKTTERLESLVSAGAGRLPPIVAFGARHLRDFTGGLVGLGGRQVFLISQTTLTSASDRLLRFVLLHDLGHRRHRHLLLSTLAGWAWVSIGLCVSRLFIAHFAPRVVGLPPYIAWLAFCLSVWMAVGEPLLAYLGRRLEYQADRFYLRHGGSVAEMTAALEELSARNLAQTEGLRRRQTLFHPLPSVWNRLHAARQFEQGA